MSDLSQLAKRIEKQGRGGDSTLLHVNKQELKTLEALLGEIGTNPETGLPEAFSWKKLLAAVGGVAASIAFPAISPYLIPASLGMGISSLIPGKKESPSGSEAGKYADERAALRKKGHYDFAPPMTTLSSLAPPDLLGRQRNNFIAPMGNRNPLANIADNVDASTDGFGMPFYRRPYAKGGVASEASAKEQVLAILAKMQAQQQGQPQQPMAPGRMVKGMGSGLSDSIPAELSDGEYVMPADVVSMMGDGSTDAGGRQLDRLVAKVRVQKTGTRKQAGKMRVPRGIRMRNG